MVKETLAKIEAAIKQIDSLDAAHKKELGRLVSRLKVEVERLDKTHADDARSIAGFVQVATHEATRKNRTPGLRRLTLEGLASSVQGFEASHPEMVKTTNDICNFLAGIGI